MNTRAKPDHLTLKAQRLGYPARSVFKLEEIQKKYSLIQKGKPVLDLGASPGSWTLYALKILGRHARISSIDLNPLNIKTSKYHSPQLHFWQGDLKSAEADHFIQTGGPYGCIMSDASLATSGNRIVDTSRSYELVNCIINLASRHLASRGHFVAKIFQGGDENTALAQLTSLFSEARLFKPKSVRSESMETYLIGRGFTGHALSH